VQDPRGYGGEIMPSSVTGATIDFTKPTGTRSGLFVYGAGDHGGGGTARDIEAALRLDGEPFLPRVCLSGATAFYEAALKDLEASKAKPDFGLPVVRGELNTVFEGCYTSHGDIKRLNRSSENSLLTAETAATLATLLTGADYPAAQLAEGWKTTCFHQFHDILCGCAIGVTYREAGERLDKVLETAGQVTRDALAALAGAVDTGAGSGPRIVVFNPLAWERDDVVRMPASALGAEVPAALVDEAGNVLPVQIIDGADGASQLMFVAQRVPAFGVRVYRAVESGQVADLSGLSADPRDNSASNGILSLRVNPASGALDRLVDVEAGIDTGAPPSGWGPEAKVNAGMLNRLQIYWEQPHPMSAWNIGDITRVDSLITGAEVRVVESGPVAAVIEVKRRFLNSAFSQRIHLYRGLRRIDFQTEIDWHERGSAHADAPMLRTTFAPFLDKTTATFEVPFGAVERAADGRETPALRWADVSEAASTGRGRRAQAARSPYGISLLNDCKYGYHAHGNTLGLTLVRASYEPDVNPDEGLHRFTYSLYPHAGDWREAGTVRRAAELNQPLLTVVTEPHDGSLKPGESWLSCEGDGAVVSALKLAEDQPGEGQSVVVRLYEAYGAPADVRLAAAWPVATASEADPIEKPISDVPVRDGAVRLSLNGYEIKTVVLS
jgi:alpha-mannosidase